MPGRPVRTPAATARPKRPPLSPSPWREPAARPQDPRWSRGSAAPAGSSSAPTGWSPARLDWVEAAPEGSSEGSCRGPAAARSSAGPGPPVGPAAGGLDRPAAGGLSRRAGGTGRGGRGPRLPLGRGLLGVAPGVAWDRCRSCPDETRAGPIGGMGGWAGSAGEGRPLGDLRAGLDICPCAALCEPVAVRRRGRTRLRGWRLGS
mmetsp:Transcript_23245/g.39989  ORF Transcript_23245/g.39989 Transcript_23245/m.39989 type:complete len:204 (-) Transcript_23245:607-1218(-)